MSEIVTMSYYMNVKIIAHVIFDEPVNITSDMRIKTTYRPDGVEIEVIDIKTDMVIKTGFGPWENTELRNALTA